MAMFVDVKTKNVTFTLSEMPSRLINNLNTNSPPTQKLLKKLLWKFVSNKPQPGLKPTVPKNLPSAPTSRMPATSSAIFKEALARKQDVTIFRAYTHAGMISSAWLWGSICFGGALFITNARLWEANEGLPWFVPGTYRVIGVALIAVGAWSILRSGKLLSSIDVLAGSEKPRLLFRVRRNIPLPFIPPKKLVVDLTDVVIDKTVVAQLGRSHHDISPAGGIVSNTLIRMKISIFRFFIGARQFWFSDGVLRVHVRGRRGIWKIDTYGWHMDEGLVLSQTLKISDVGKSIFGENTKGRRYGELDAGSQVIIAAWANEPTDRGILTAIGSVEYIENSFEEWKLQGLIEGETPGNQPGHVQRDYNPFSIMQGSSAMVEVYVGDATWHLHQDIVNAACPYFLDILNVQRLELKEPKITLDQVENEIFQVFVQYLYSKNVDTRILTILIPAYILANKLEALDFKARVLDKIFGLYGDSCPFSIEQVLYIIENTPSGSGLTKLAVDSLAIAILSGEVKSNKKLWEELAPILPEMVEGIASILAVQEKRGHKTCKRKPRMEYVDEQFGTLDLAEKMTSVTEKKVDDGADKASG